MLKGNKGDWSAAYAFLRLLEQGKINFAGEDLSPVSNHFFEVKEISREGIRFVREEKEISFYKNNVKIGSCFYDWIKSTLPSFWREIIKGGGKTYECLTGSEMLRRLGLTRLIASENSKADLEIKPADSGQFGHDTFSFSTKSFAGSASTLFNGSHATKFVFEVIGLEPTDVACLRENGNNATQVKDFLIQNNPRVELSFYDMMDDCCRKNFILIDALFPYIFADMIKAHYLGKSNRIDEISDFLASEDPLHFDNPICYEKKIKDFLMAVALGMEPKTPWTGEEQSSAGYIIVKRNGDLVCCNALNRNSFKSFLFHHCKMDSPSGTKFLNKGESNPDGTVYEKDGRFLINLNRQIRFF